MNKKLVISIALGASAIFVFSMLPKNGSKQDSKKRNSGISGQIDPKKRSGKNEGISKDKANDDSDLQKACKVETDTDDEGQGMTDAFGTKCSGAEIFPIYRVGSQSEDGTSVELHFAYCEDNEEILKARYSKKKFKKAKLKVGDPVCVLSEAEDRE